MLEVTCSGTPFEVGLQHGKGAGDKVKGSLAFYEALFKSTCSLSWDAVCEEAAKYVESLTRLCPDYVEEMRGIAEGAGVKFLDIVALNVRTEITFGLFTLNQPIPPIDGCTSLAYKLQHGDSILAQNWDWQHEQSENLFIYRVSRTGPNIPALIMVTEGGIIGKIGFNSKGVGVCLNAIRARGVNTLQLPVHLALRTILESNSRQEAIDRLKSTGVAGSAHLLVADRNGSTGLECTSIGIKEITMDDDGIVAHANNLILDHPDVDEPPWLADSPLRTVRIRALLKDKSLPSLGFSELFEVFKDEEGYPASINRHQVDGCETQTLFNILMNLTSSEAMVTFGRPTNYSERVQLKLEAI